MMSEAFSIGPRPVYWYGIMMALGFLAGLANWTLLGRKSGRDFKFCSDLLFWIMLAGILGARVAYVLSDLSYFLANPLRIVRIDEGGLIFFGGFLGACLALHLFARSTRSPFLELADFVVTSLPLAHAFGRVGCFMHGCCFGTPLACGVHYPKGSTVYVEHQMNHLLTYDAARSLPVHAVQLYESAFNLVLFGVLLLVWRSKPRAGTVGAVYLLLYPVGRFALEFLRGDHRVRWAGLSVAQWVSIALFAAGWGLWWWLRPRDHGKRVTA